MIFTPYSSDYGETPFPFDDPEGWRRSPTALRWGKKPGFIAFTETPEGWVIVDLGLQGRWAIGRLANAP